jgi:hypothetical protein
MASVHIRRVVLASGAVRYRVRYRLGGAETNHRYAGSFRTRREAEARARWVAGELAAMRVPDLRALADRQPRTMTVAAADWQASRIDVADNTRNVHRKSLVHVLAAFGDHDPASITPAEVAAWVGTLAARFTPGYTRKIVDALAMVLDHEGIAANPARDRRVRLPRNVTEEIEPPEAEDVEAVIGAVAPRYRRVLVVLDASAMRSGSSKGCGGATSIAPTPAGGWPDSARRAEGGAGFRCRRKSSPRWTPSLPARTATSMPPSSPGFGRPASAPKSAAPVRRLRRPSGALTTCATAGSASGIAPASAGHRSASGRDSGTSPQPPIATRTSSSAARSTTPPC